MDFYDGGDRLIAGSIKLVSNWPLLYKLRGIENRLPLGELFVIDARESPRDPGLSELGDSVQLVYVDGADLTSLLNKDGG